MSDSHELSRAQEAYYGDLFGKHGVGVDAVASGKQIFKDLRYRKLSEVFEGDTNFTLHDVGFGLGHYLEYLNLNHAELGIVYSGSEVTRSFVDHCRTAHPDLAFHHRDLAVRPFEEAYDYLVFGGTFYHQVDASHEEFTEFVQGVLRHGFECARRGMAFNFITDFVEYKYPDLYYCRIGEMIDFVVSNLSRYFVVDHAVPLYECTFKVYREDRIRTDFPDPDFHKYFKSGD